MPVSIQIGDGGARSRWAGTRAVGMHSGPTVVIRWPDICFITARNDPSLPAVLFWESNPVTQLTGAGAVLQDIKRGLGPCIRSLRTVSSQISTPESEKELLESLLASYEEIRNLFVGQGRRDVRSIRVPWKEHTVIVRTEDQSQD